MVDILKAFAVVALALGAFAGIFLFLYWLTTFLKGTWQERTRVWLFIGPALLFLSVGLLVPAARTIYLSLFTDDTGNKFVGLRNFIDIFTGSGSAPDGPTVLRNNLLWVVLVPLLSTVAGLFVARTADGMRGENIIKALIFLPTVISFVGAGIIWKFIYAYRSEGQKQIGLLNQIWIWLGGKPSQFLINSPLNNLFLIVVMIWVQAGFATVVYSAALKGVDDSMLEAARIDGATENQTFFRIIIPNIRVTIVVVLTTTFIATLKVYDIVKAMTGGNFKTSVIANEMYSQSFERGKPFLGAAFAVILFVAVIPMIVINIKNNRLSRENA